MEYALITGASRGIGKGIALAMAAAGYNLILTCHRNSSQLLQTADMAKNLGVQVVTFCGDISKPQVCEELFSMLSDKNIYPHILINNAGISYVGLLQDMTYEEWDNCISTNLSSIFYICRLAIPSMLSKHKGKIINISSVWGNAGASCEVAYSAAKGGVNAFTKALAKELAPSNIQINAIAFGAIDTDMNSHLDDNEKNILIEEIPSGRMGNIDEAGQMVLNILNSPDYLTGQIITMDGGWL